jgi:hypothetical protein
MLTPTIEVDPLRLEAGIDALARAGRALELSRFERISYRMLMVSADVAIVSFVAIILVMIAAAAANHDSAFILVGIVGAVFGLAILFGVAALALNIPLFRRASQERARLKQLGLDALSTSLWQESQRSRWVSRIRSGLLIAIGAFSVFGVVTGLIMTFFDNPIDAVFISLFYAMLATLLFAARYLRKQRERIELAASAENLQTILRGMQQHAGEDGTVAVPSDILAQAARIETAQIAQERKDAVLQSVAARPSGYAVRFDPSAAEQRTTLAIAARIELEDLVAQISTGGPNLEARAGSVIRRDGATFRARSSSGGIEIECVLDESSRSVRVTAVTKTGVTAAPVPPTETGHG